MKSKKLFVFAAGSGGHLLPALQLARQWKQEHTNGQVFVFTGTTALERAIIQQHPWIGKTIHLRLNKFSLRQWWNIPIVTFQSVFIFFAGVWFSLLHRPEKALSTGGLLAIPLSIATRLTRRTVDLYELNVLPGKASKALFPFVNTIYTVFLQAKQHCRWKRFDFTNKCVLTTYPLRFTQQDKNVDKTVVVNSINQTLKQQQASHLFDHQRKTIFVLGGSQGSQLLNRLIKEFVEKNVELCSSLQVLHQVGSFNEQEWNDWYANHEIPALIFNYDQRVHEYYALADVVVCRAGAGTLFELAFFKNKSLVIPLVAPTTDHQIHNAHALAEQYPELFTVLNQALAQENSALFIETLKVLLTPILKNI